jgi:hypothetical protein
LSGLSRSKVLIGAATLASAVLVIAYLAAGGASYEPTAVRDPCQPREWRSPDTIQEIVEQFSLSALDGAACELRVSRERLARALATPKARERFARTHGIDDAQLEAAVRAGLVRAIDDAEDAGALPPLAATPLRELAQRLPVEAAIELINDARPLFEGAGGLFDLLDEARGLVPDELQPFLP